MQILRAVVFDFIELATARAQHPQQGKAVQMPALRAVLRPADESRSALEEARDGRTQFAGFAETRIRVGRERRDLLRRNSQLYR